MLKRANTYIICLALLKASSFSASVKDSSALFSFSFSLSLNKQSRLIKIKVKHLKNFKSIEAKAWSDLKHFIGFKYFLTLNHSFYFFCKEIFEIRV